MKYPIKSLKTTKYARNNTKETLRLLISTEITTKNEYMGLTHNIILYALGKIRNKHHYF